MKKMNLSLFYPNDELVQFHSMCGFKTIRFCNLFSQEIVIDKRIKERRKKDKNNNVNRIVVGRMRRKKFATTIPTKTYQLTTQTTIEQHSFALKFIGF